jgi:hypothetical protein
VSQSPVSRTCTAVRLLPGFHGPCSSLDAEAGETHHGCEPTAGRKAETNVSLAIGDRSVQLQPRLTSCLFVSQALPCLAHDAERVRPPQQETSPSHGIKASHPVCGASRYISHINTYRLVASDRSTRQTHPQAPERDEHLHSRQRQRLVRAAGQGDWLPSPSVAHHQGRGWQAGAE